MTWRARAAPIIAKVLADTEGKPEEDIRRALYAAYPFGPRKMHPYKIWLDEIKRQRGEKPPLGTRGVKRLSGVPGDDDPDQGRLFE